MRRCRAISSLQSPGRSRAGWLRGAVGVSALVALALPLAADSVKPRALVVVVPIRGVIDDIVRDSVQRRIDEAQSRGAKTIIFELDTPGGAVTSALDICRLIKSIPGDVRTVAWVNKQAYSAGAMIAVACREIWMSPASSIGDCAPIMISPTGPVTLGEVERAKVESPIIQEFRDSATRNGYDPLLSRAMVVTGDEVWWIEKIAEPSERRFVDPDEKTRLIDDVEPESREWRLVERAVVERASGETREVKVGQPVDRKDELLTMSQYDAVIYGFARGIAQDLEDLAMKLGVPAAPVVLDKSGWEKFAIWLNSPLVRGLLLIIVLVGAYLEFQHPGMIVPGATALIALAIFLAAPYAAGLANIWTIIVLAIGIILLCVEIFVIPGFGIAGLLGIAFVLIAMLGTFVPSEPNAPPFSLPTLPATWDGLWMGLRVMTISILVSLVGIFLLVTYLPRTKLAEGVISGNPDAVALAIDTPYAHVAHVGDIGVVTGDLRPAGQARFGQEVVEVRSQGEYVAKGHRVQVIRREGLDIWVRPLSEEPRA